MEQIPIPNHPRAYKWPWEELKAPGDSFFSKMTPGQRRGMHRGAHRIGIQITYRRRKERGVVGYRVWRTE